MEYILHIMATICIYAIISGSYNLVWGLGGMLSLAHAAVFGVGAYVTAILAQNGHGDIISAMPAAAAAGAAASALLAVSSRRLDNDFFVILSFAFQAVLVSLANNWISLTNGPGGITGYTPLHVLGLPVDTAPKVLALCAAAFLVIQAMLWVIATSPMGRLLRAIREDPVLASSLGKAVLGQKLRAAAIGGAFAGVAGNLFSSLIGIVDPTSFSLNESIFVLSLVIIGGAGTVWGPPAGAVLLVLLPELILKCGVSPDYAANVREMVYGAAIVAFLIWCPNGLLGGRSRSGGTL